MFSGGINAPNAISSAAIAAAFLPCVQFTEPAGTAAKTRLVLASADASVGAALVSVSGTRTCGAPHWLQNAAPSLRTAPQRWQICSTART